MIPDSSGTSSWHRPSREPNQVQHVSLAVQPKARYPSLSPCSKPKLCLRPGQLGKDPE